MAIQLLFDQFHRYSDQPEDGVVIPVSLVSGGLLVTTHAAVDTGASVCLFSQETALMLGLDLERGVPKLLGTLAGPLEAFGHEVTLEALSLTVQSVVYFARYPGLSRNLLGRQGWLRKLRLGLVDYESLVYLSRYDS